MATRHIKTLPSNRFDGEVLGLVLFAVGIFLGVTVALPETGNGLMAVANRLITGQLAWGSYLLPLVPVIFGVLVFLGRDVRPTLRRVLGSLLVVAALLCLHALLRPGEGGALAQEMMEPLYGTLSYAAALLPLIVLTLGLEIVLRLSPTHVLRRFFLGLSLGVAGVVALGQRFVEGRSTGRELAQDRYTLRQGLAAQGRELESLSRLYPQSPELRDWSREIRDATRALASQGTEGLRLAQQELDQTREVSAGFVRAAAADLLAGVRAEVPACVAEITARSAAVRAGSDPLSTELPSTMASGALDTVRRGLVVELSRLNSKVAGLERARQRAESQLDGASAATLLQERPSYLSRLAEWEALDTRYQPWASRAGLYPGWPELCSRYDQSSTENAGQLAEALDLRPDEALADLSGWSVLLEQPQDPPAAPAPADSPVPGPAVSGAPPSFDFSFQAAPTLVPAASYQPPLMGRQTAPPDEAALPDQTARPAQASASGVTPTATAEADLWTDPLEAALTLPGATVPEDVPFPSPGTPVVIRAERPTTPERPVLQERTVLTGEPARVTELSDVDGADTDADGSEHGGPRLARLAETPPWELDDGQATAAPRRSAPHKGATSIAIPSLSLLDPVPPVNVQSETLDIQARARAELINLTLTHFGLSGKVVDYARGPTVTRYEIEPAPGEKISRISSLSNDLARALAVGGVRVEAPVPGKSVIGLEVPNAEREPVTFHTALASPTFARSRARLPIVLGKSIDGDMMVGDLAKMPHLLIAGSTGSGKSVCVNTLICSLLFRYLPTELRFLMVDPKMVELTPYDGIPHLVRGVVTNPVDAAGVLLGAVAHMERRYKMMSQIGAKNLEQYNEKMRATGDTELPHLVIIIDELADLMITSPKEVESAIMRLAQMARATGMHLVLATQRPSVDILTSLIKVNVPARIAFAVSSTHDSRTILDSMGAERLTGMGDMLFYQPGLTKPMRLQGPYISEAETLRMADELRRQVFDDWFVEAYGADFDGVIEAGGGTVGSAANMDFSDPLLRQAALICIEEGQGSVSKLQRRLSVGHARAGKLMDLLEAMNIVSKNKGSKPRDVLISEADLPEYFGK